MTRTAGAPMGCQRPSRFWGLGCPKIYHEAEDTLAILLPSLQRSQSRFGKYGFYHCVLRAECVLCPVGLPNEEQ
ncbi:hypothetical protein, partial [Thiolapillus sp.]|uniref:hypothetical protein n=1 Tax=Thiolapillus sp. TaxID=2017437 RepID=UPI00263A8A7E